MQVLEHAARCSVPATHASLRQRPSRCFTVARLCVRVRVFRVFRVFRVCVCVCVCTLFLLQANAVYIDDTYKCVKLAHHCAEGILLGAPVTPCPACNNAALCVAPLLNQAFCNGNMGGFAPCTNSCAPDTMTRKAWVVTKACAKKTSPVLAFSHPFPSEAPELIMPATKAKGKGKGKANATPKRKASAIEAGAEDTGAAAPTQAAEEWKTATDPKSGKTYWYNSKGTSTWARPTPKKAKVATSAVAKAEPRVHPDPDLTGRELDMMKFYVCGRFSGGRPAIYRTITSKAGGISAQADQATHILVPTGSGSGKLLASAMADNPHLPVVDVAFLEAFDLAWRTGAGLTASGRLLFSSQAGADVPAPMGMASLAAASPPGSPAAETGAAACGAQKRRSVTKAQLRIDDECGTQGTILQGADGLVYSVTLNQVDATASKYYVMQLISCHGKYFLFRKWGSVGAMGSLNLTTKSFGARADACKEFEKVFKSKTGNAFADVLSFKKKPHKYNFVDQYADEEVGEGAGAVRAQAQEPAQATVAATAPGTALPQPVADLILKIFDAKEVARTMDAIGLNAEKLPLGQLSLRTIKLAYTTLGDVARILTAGAQTAEGRRVAGIQLKGATKKFYSLIPCQREVQAEIDGEGVLKEKIRLLDELMNIAACKDLVIQGSLSADVHKNYLSLGVQLAPLAGGDPMSQTIVDYVKLTHSAQHSQYTLKVVNILSIHDQRQSALYERFSSGIGNKQLLWHGSRLSNFTGILAQGLRIAPPEAPVTGYMFGKGACVCVCVCV